MFMELLVVLSMVAILSGISFPYWHNWEVKNHVAVLVRQVVQAIHITRLLAIARHEQMVLSGWCVDQRCISDQSRELVIENSHHQIVKVIHGFPRTYRLYWAGNFHRNRRLIFNAFGYTDGQLGSFYICPPPGDQRWARGLTVSLSGRVRTKRGTVDQFCRQ